MEPVTKNLVKILLAENPGKSPADARNEADAIMLYYEQIKRAELMCCYNV